MNPADMLRERPALVAAINLLVAAVALYWVAHAGMGLYRSWQPAPADAGPQARAPRVAADVSLSEIINARLFGTPAASPAVVAAPETRLQLRLNGVLASDSGRSGAAVISVESRPARAYRIGELIEGTDATVRFVYPDRVVLDRGGRHETLSLERPEAAGLGGDDSDPASLPQPTEAEAEAEAGNEAVLERFREELKQRGREAASQ